MSSPLRRALDATSPEAKLAALLAAWKKLRHPRVADLIDAVTAPLVRDLGPVTAPSVPGRVQACVALVRGGDPVGVGRVLATQWPGTWQQALPLVQALSKLDDPRVTAEFARQVDRGHYASLASRKLWMPVFRRLVEVKDTRQLAVLQAQAGRSKGESWSRTVQSLEATALQRLAAVKPPTLSADDEAALEQLEAPHHAARSNAAKRQQSGDELLAAVYANPADASLRAVYADWLSEHGDPRGEFISLQLGPATPKAEARARALANKHWRAWVGPLADWCCRMSGQRSTMPPTFRGGFAWAMHVGLAQYNSEDRLRALFERPEWRTVEVLREWPSSWVPLHEALAHPNFANVRVLDFFLDDAALTALAALTPAPRIEALQLGARDAELEALGSFPTLKRLALYGPGGLVFVKRELQRLDEVSFHGYRAVTELKPAHWALLEESGVCAVELGPVRVSRPRGAKHFVELLVRDVNESSAALERLPRTLERFAASQPAMSGAKEDLDALTENLRRFTKLDLGGLKHEAIAAEPVERHVVIEFSSARRFDEETALEWLLSVLVDDFGATLDAFSLDFAAAQRLPAAAEKRVGALAAWVKKSRAASLRLLEKGKPTEVQLRRDSPFVTFKLPLTDADRFLAAAQKLVQGAQARQVRVAYTDLEGDDWKPIARALRTEKK